MFEIISRLFGKRGSNTGQDEQAPDRRKRPGCARGAGSVGIEPLEERRLLAADLTGQYCLALTEQATWGAMIDIYSRIGNAGPSTVTASVVVSFWLSNNSTFSDADDYLLRSYDHPEDVPAGGYGPAFWQSMMLPNSAPSGFPATGTVYIGMKTDATNLIAETNENNNFGTVGQSHDWDSLVIGLPVDLQGNDLHAPSQAFWGASIDIQSQILNAGPGAVTGSFRVMYFLSTDTVFSEPDDFFVPSVYTHSADVPAGGLGPHFTNSLTLPSSAPSGFPATGTIYIGMMTDEMNLITEYNESNNYGDIGQYYDWDSIVVDLPVDLSGFDCYVPSQASWGGSIDIQSQIHNAGSGAVTESFGVDYYLSNDTVFGNADDYYLGDYWHIADVPAGEYGPDYTRTLTLPDVLPSGYPATGTVYIGMKTDAANLIAETNESNNFGTCGKTWDWDSVVISSPVDLSGYDCSAPLQAPWGVSIDIQSQIRNAGSGAVTESFYVRYYLSNDTVFGDADDYYLDQYWHIADVPAWGYGPSYNKTLALPYSAPSGFPTTGTIYIGMETDTTNLIAETNENNNFGTVGQHRDWDSLFISPSYDLSGAVCMLADDTLEWGQDFDVQSRVANSRTANVTDTFWVHYWLSNDSIFGDGDDYMLLGGYSHSADVPGGGMGPLYNIGLTLPATAPAGYDGAGPYYLAMKIDSTNAIIETNEANNFGQIGIHSDYDSWTALAAEVRVTGLGVNIYSGDGSPSPADGTDYAQVGLGQPGVSHSFVVWNDGTGALSLSGLNVPSGYSITDGLPSVLAPGASDTMTVQLNTGTGGTKNGQISFSSNDGDESSFTFAITGRVRLAAMYGTSAADTFGVRPSSGNIEFFENQPMSGPPTWIMSAGIVSGITVTGNEGVDNLTVQAVAAPVAFDGGEGWDNLTISGGLVQLGTSQDLASLSISDGGRLELGNAAIAVRGGSAATLYALAVSGHAGGTWTGSGLTSSVAAGDPTHELGVAVGPNNAGGGQSFYGPGGSIRPTWMGLSDLLLGDVLIRCTKHGDADLDGDVDGNDVARWSLAFTGELGGGPTATRMSTDGDWDYDGNVDGNDVGIWSLNFTGELGGVESFSQNPLTTAAVATQSVRTTPGRSTRSAYLPATRSTRAAR